MALWSLHKILQDGIQEFDSQTQPIPNKKSNKNNKTDSNTTTSTNATTTTTTLNSTSKKWKRDALMAQKKVYFYFVWANEYFEENKSLLSVLESKVNEEWERQKGLLAIRGKKPDTSKVANIISSTTHSNSTTNNNNNNNINGPMIEEIIESNDNNLNANSKSKSNSSSSSSTTTNNNGNLSALDPSSLILSQQTAGNPQ